jgi:hypothetical protein
MTYQWPDDLPLLVHGGEYLTSRAEETRQQQKKQPQRHQHAKSESQSTGTSKIP